MAKSRSHFLATSMARGRFDESVLNANRAQVPRTRFANSFTSSQRDIYSFSFSGGKSGEVCKYLVKRKSVKVLGEKPQFVVTLICLPHCKYLMELK